MSAAEIREQMGGNWEERSDGWWLPLPPEQIRAAAGSMLAGGARFVALVVSPDSQGVFGMSWHWDSKGYTAVGHDDAGSRKARAQYRRHLYRSRLGRARDARLLCRSLRGPPFHATADAARRRCARYDAVSRGGPSMSYRIPIGPYHLALEEPYKIELDCQGERVTGATLKVGFNFRGIEWLAERKNITKAIALMERVCGICSMCIP